MGEATALTTLTAGSNALAQVDYGDDAGGGFENTTSADFKTPWLRVLDAKSKDVESVPGAKAGLIINTVTKALFENILFVPAVTEAWYVEWKPRGQGGGGGQGFVAALKPDDPKVQKALAALAAKGGKFAKGPDGKNLLPKSEAGNDYVETYYIHGNQLVEETGDINKAILSFSSTGIPVYQSWLGLANDQKTTNKDGQRVPKPLFAHVYRLGSAKQEKNGNSWYNFTPRFANEGAQGSLLDPTSDIYQKTRQVKLDVLAGKAKVDHASSGAGETGAPKEDIPF